MMSDNEAGPGDSPKYTIKDRWLRSNRDALVSMLCSWWPQVGWPLTTASDRERIRDSLLPLQNHSDRHLIDRLIRQTDAVATASGIRQTRIVYRAAVERRCKAQAERDRCVNECRELEAAINAASDEQIDTVLREFSKHGTEYHSAQKKTVIAEQEEAAVEKALLEMESAYAQDQLLIFIKKRKYALHPLNLANAMAGLPYAIDLPFRGAWQSHARCSSVDCPGWPSYRYQVFETIQSIWENSEHSTLPTVEFFRQQICRLPKTVMQTHPTIGKHKCENYVRSYLSDNWWDLERAISASLETKNDPRPMHFIIATNLDLFVGQSKTLADVALAKAARLCD
jgi:hypothetical protein